MFWLTLRQEVCWCDDFMAWCLSFGDLNCGILYVRGKLSVVWFFLNFFFLLFSQLCGHRGTTIDCFLSVYQDCLSAQHNLGTSSQIAVPVLKRETL